jgi:hypothetical protein
LSCPALQLTSQKPKRTRFSQKHQSDGIRLADVLRQYQKDFPRFAAQLDECIERVKADAARTRATDRKKVLKALMEWDGLTQQEIVEETGLSRWDVRQVLYGLRDRGLIDEHLQVLPGVQPTRSRTLYSLKSHADGFLS